MLILLDFSNDVLYLYTMPAASQSARVTASAPMRRPARGQTFADASQTAKPAEICTADGSDGFEIAYPHVRARRLTHAKRISYGYLTAKAADLSQSNASNGYDFVPHAHAEREGSCAPLSAGTVRP